MTRQKDKIAQLENLVRAGQESWKFKTNELAEANKRIQKLEADIKNFKQVVETLGATISHLGEVIRHQ